VGGWLTDGWARREGRFSLDDFEFNIDVAGDTLQILDLGRSEVDDNKRKEKRKKRKRKISNDQWALQIK